MNFSPQQDSALRKVSEWLKRGEPQVFRLFGYAGTGKTTLARYLAEDIDGPVHFVAYTGKAASVLVAKGCPATTVHRLIYLPKQRSVQRLRELEGKLAALSMDAPPREREALLRQIREERDNATRPMFSLNHESPAATASLVVVDEGSMIDSKMGEDLLSFGCPVLILADPGQLPPVAGQGFFTSGEPDFMLTEIHRQARESPVLRLATQARLGEPLEEGWYGPDSIFQTSHVMDRKDLDPRLPLLADQVLVGRNKTRRASNRRIRQLLNREEVLPEPQDRLVCLRNDYELGLLNGTIWEVITRDYNESERVGLTIHPEGEPESPLEIEAHEHHFLGTEDSLPVWERREAQEFTYGYALTVHKAQGSQWGHVLILDESRVFRKHRREWLYTAITRAEHAVDIVLNC